MNTTETILNFMNARIYLDHHSKTYPDPKALEKAFLFLKEYWGDSASPHKVGQEGVEKILECYQELFTLLGLDEEDENVFVNSGAEAISQVFFSVYVDIVRSTGKNHILTTAIEEAPFLLSLKQMENLGCAIKALPVNHRGQLSLETVQEAIKPRTSLLSFSWASSLTGVIHPIEEITALCSLQGVRVHVDASAVFGKLFFRFKDLGVDYLTLDGSVLHAPLGTSLIICKKGAPLSPMILGKKSLDKAGIISLKIALEKGLEKFDHMSTEISRLRDTLEQKLETLFPESLTFFQKVERLSHVTTIAFPGVASEALLFALDNEGVYASLGGGKMQKLSHVLLESKSDPLLAHSALSFALSYDTTEEEIDEAANIIAECALELRKLSSHMILARLS